MENATQTRGRLFSSTTKMEGLPNIAQNYGSHGYGTLLDMPMRGLPSIFSVTYASATEYSPRQPMRALPSIAENYGSEDYRAFYQ